MAYKTFGQLKVKNPTRKNHPERDQPLILTFIEDDVMWHTKLRLILAGYEIVDESPGYKLFRSVDDAMDSARAHLGNVKKEEVQS